LAWRGRQSHNLLGVAVHILNDAVHQPIDILRYVPIDKLLPTVRAHLGWHIAYRDMGVAQLKDHFYHTIFNLLPTFWAFEGCVYIHLRFHTRNIVLGCPQKTRLWTIEGRFLRRAMVP